MAQVRWQGVLSFFCLSASVFIFQTKKLSADDLNAYYARGGNKVVYQMGFLQKYGVEPTSAPFLSSKGICYVVDVNRKIRCYDKEEDELYADQFKDYDVHALYPPFFSPEGDVCFLADSNEVVYLSFEGTEYGKYQNTQPEFSPPVIGKDSKVYFAEAGVGYSMDKKGQIDVVEDFFGDQGNRDEKLMLFPLCDPEGCLYWVVIKRQEKLVVFDPVGSSYFCPIENLTLRPGSIMISNAKDLVYITEEGNIIAVNFLEGEVQQTSFQVPGLAEIDSSGMIYFGMNGKICWVPSSLVEIEQREVGGAVVGRPVLWANNTICFLLTNNEVCWVKHFEGFL